MSFYSAISKGSKIVFYIVLVTCLLLEDPTYMKLEKYFLIFNILLLLYIAKLTNIEFRDIGNFPVKLWPYFCVTIENITRQPICHQFMSRCLPYAVFLEKHLIFLVPNFPMDNIMIRGTIKQRFCKNIFKWFH